MHTEYLPVVISGAALLMSAWNAYRAKQPIETRDAVRRRWAREAVDYAEQMGGDKLGHALGYFEVVDARHKAYDFSGAEARVAIESELGSRG